MQTFETWAGDTAKPLEAVLADEDGIVSLLGASCRVNMAPVRSSGLTAPVVNAVATIVNPNAVEGEDGFGLVRYFFADADVAVPGVYHAVFKVTFGDGKQETFPSDEPIEVTLNRSVLP